MSDAQSWTVVLGGLAAIFSMMGLTTASFNRTLRSEIGRVEARIEGAFGTLAGRIGTLDGKIDGKIAALQAELSGEIGSLRSEMRAEFRRVDERLDHLDRDVQALTRHVFDRPE